MGIAHRHITYSGALIWCFAAMLGIAAFSSCKYLRKKSPTSGEIVLARANNDYLYLSDLAGLTKNMPPKDSVTFIANYSESWVRRKLLLKKAEENVPYDELGIDKKVEEYRQSLLLYEYEKELINQKLDKGVSDAEIADFYDKNKDKFTLDGDIYDVQYLEIHSDAQDLDKMRPIIMHPKTEEDYNKREGYCKVYALSYSFADSNWMNSSGVLKKFPISGLDLKSLSAGSHFVEYKNSRDSYFMYIKNVRHQGEPSPLAFIKNQIKEVVVNKKKVILIQKIYDDIYTDAVKSGKSEVLARK